jgi:hypothetical protein
VSLFKKWFGSTRDKSDLSLREIAAALGLENATVSFDGARTGTLEGHYFGGALLLRYGAGMVPTCTLAHEDLSSRIDLELDLNQKKRAVVELEKALDAPTGVGDAVHLGGGLLLAREDIPDFRRLPESVRARLLTEMRESNLVRLRAGREAIELVFSGDDESRTSQAQLVRALSFSMEICKARGLSRTRAPRKASMTPLEAATAFASEVGGAQVEDLSDDDGLGGRGIWARVTFKHQQIPLQLVFYRFDKVTCNVWLETRAAGKLGRFALMLWDGEEAERPLAPSEAEEGEDELPMERFFVSKASYLESTRVRVEAARIFSLPGEFKARLVTLAETNQAVVLEEEVLSLNLGDLVDFLDARRQPPTGPAYPLALGIELGKIAEALPVQSKTQATLAESRTCSFCDAKYVFSPETPECVRCGAPPAVPGARQGRLRTGSLEQKQLGLGSLEQKQLGESRIAPLRRYAEDLVRRAPSAVVREEPDAYRIVVLLELQGAAVSVVLAWSGFSVETRVAGLGGDLALGAFEEEEGGSQAEEWNLSARPLFVSKRCRFQSDHADEELERFVSLPPQLQARIIAICERYDGAAVLEAERFELLLGLDHRHENGDALYAYACEVVEIARAFPPTWDRKAPVRSRVHACAHCDAVVFLPEDGASCVRCGAPA